MVTKEGACDRTKNGVRCSAPHIFHLTSHIFHSAAASLWGLTAAWGGRIFCRGEGAMKTFFKLVLLAALACGDAAQAVKLGDSRMDVVAELGAPSGFIRCGKEETDRKSVV